MPLMSLGAIRLQFGTAYAAGEAVKTFDGRFFGGRKLSCQYWDGVTDYTVKEEDKDEVRVKRDVGFVLTWRLWIPVENGLSYI